jgi:starch synthase (maltosyl-transferring)
MNLRDGKKRVIITQVSPVVEGGKYPAKAVINEDITLSADIFGDGHDDVAASVFVKHLQTGTVVELPMTLVLNDRWEAVYTVHATGIHEFWIHGWEDHYGTWKKGLVKKYEAGQDIGLELQIGAGLLNAAAKALPDEGPLLTSTASRMEQADAAGGVVIALNEEIAAVMFKFRPEESVTVYPLVLKINAERKRAAFSSWYELFPRSASPEPGKHGTFKDVERLLPRIHTMGFDVLYFPPIHPIGEKNRKGKNNSLHAAAEDPGSPWAIGNKRGGHKAIHSQLGTLGDFKRLNKAANKLGIELAMDIAYQCAPDHPYVKQHPQWFKWRPDGTVQFAENPPKKYEDILPFDFETDDWENLWIELKSIIEYWIDAGIRIFRIDNPHTKAFNFWEWMIAEVKKSNPDVLFLAEAFTRPRLMERLAKAGFNQSYTYFTWRNTKYELETYLTELTKTEMRYYFRPNFWPNTPDILPPALINGGENAHIMRLILAATLSSNYGLYGPVYEFGINTPHGSKEEYIDNEKYEIKHWNWKKYTRILELIIRINKIRKENAALHTTWNIEFVKTTGDQLICYSKVDLKNNSRMLIVVNLDVAQTQSATIQIPFETLDLDPAEGFTAHDLLSGDTYYWQGEWQYVELNPYLMPAHIFRIEQ